MINRFTYSAGSLAGSKIEASRQYLDIFIRKSSTDILNQAAQVGNSKLFTVFMNGVVDCDPCGS